MNNKQIVYPNDDGMVEVRCPFCNAVILSDTAENEDLLKKTCRHLLLAHNNAAIYDDNFWFINPIISIEYEEMKRKEAEIRLLEDGKDPKDPTIDWEDELSWPFEDSKMFLILFAISIPKLKLFVLKQKAALVAAPLVKLQILFSSLMSQKQANAR